MKINKWIILGLFLLSIGMFPATGVMAQEGYPYLTQLRASGTVIDYQQGVRDGYGILTLRDWKGQEMTFWVPDHSMFKGEISAGAMKVVTYDVEAYHGEHMAVAKGITPHTGSLLANESQCNIC